jgi:hypothetical protein
MLPLPLGITDVLPNICVSLRRSSMLRFFHTRGGLSLPEMLGINRACQKVTF